MLFLKFHILFSVWPDSLKKTKTRRGRLGIWVTRFPVPVPSSPAVTCSKGNIPPCPSPQRSPSSLSKVLHFQFLHSAWHGVAAASRCFLVCVSARLRGCWTHRGQGFSPDSATGRLCGFRKLTFLSLGSLLCSATCVMRLSG